MTFSFDEEIGFSEILIAQPRYFRSGERSQYSYGYTLSIGISDKISEATACINFSVPVQEVEQTDFVYKKCTDANGKGVSGRYAFVESTSEWGLQFYQLAFISVSCDSLHPKLTLADPSNTNFKFTLSDLEETWYVPLPLFNCKSKADKRELMDFSI